MNFLSRLFGKSEPAAPTAMAMGAPVAPAIGAWRMGNSMPSRSRIRVSGHWLISAVLLLEKIGE